MTAPTVRCPVCSEALPAIVRYDPLPPDGSQLVEVHSVDPAAWSEHTRDHNPRRLALVR